VSTEHGDRESKEDAESTEATRAPEASPAPAPELAAPPAPAPVAAPSDAQHLVKLSYHDSGIDIRDPLLHVTPAKSKTVYSDADIVLSADWVPPVYLPRSEPPLSAPPLGEAERAPRKPAAMLKRLSYPLSWVEGLTGEGAPAHAADAPPAPDSHNTSVFSKVFNSSPMNLVEFGTGLFLSKTPSEEAPQDVVAGPGYVRSRSLQTLHVPAPSVNDETGVI
ncbi:hypothetical protein MSG28_000486, partial [Choristoneura fumiferana]